MKKIGCLLLILLLMLGIYESSFAASLNDNYKNDCIEHLCRYGFDIDVADFETGIIRREMFELCYKLQNDNQDPYEEMFDYFNDYLDAPQFVDVEKYSKDYYLAYLLTDYRLMKGDLSEGVHYARFDDYATYGEAITVVLRALSRFGYYMVQEEILVELYGSENTYYHYAESVGLINTVNPSDRYAIKISETDLNKQIPAGDFAVLLDRALYIPSASQGDYAPSGRHYTIDTCEKYHWQFVLGSERSYYELRFVGKRYDILSGIMNKTNENPIVVLLKDGTEMVYFYDDAEEFPTEVYRKTSVLLSDFDEIVVGISDIYDVKKIDPKGNYAIPADISEEICSVHYTADDARLKVYYDAVELANGSANMRVSKIVLVE